MMPPLLSDLLSHRLRCETDLEVVAEVSDPVELLVAVRESRAHAVIVPLLESGDLPGVASHLLAEYPGRRVIGLSFGPDMLYTAERVTGASVQNLLDAIRRTPARDDAPA
jgi:hypothetical protein